MDTSQSLAPLASSEDSSDSWFSKLPVLLLQLQYTPLFLRLGSATTYENTRQDSTKAQQGAVSYRHSA